MKKLFLLLVTVIAFTVTASAQKNFNYQQRTVRDEIKTYIQAEGYVPTIDSDGDIKFKREGHTYYVIINEKDTDPMFVTLCRIFEYDEDATKAALAVHAPTINEWKMAKLLLQNSYFSVRCEMYLTDSKAFTSVFNKMVKQVDNAAKELSDLL